MEGSCHGTHIGLLAMGHNWPSARGLDNPELQHILAAAG